MNKLIFPLAAALIAAASYDASGEAPPIPAAEKANPVVDPTMVQMPLKGKEPMPTEMKKEGMMKEDVKKEYMKKEPMIEEIMEKEEVKN